MKTQTLGRDRTGTDERAGPKRKDPAGVAVPAFCCDIRIQRQLTVLRYADDLSFGIARLGTVCVREEREAQLFDQGDQSSNDTFDHIKFPATTVTDRVIAIALGLVYQNFITGRELRSITHRQLIAALLGISHEVGTYAKAQVSAMDMQVAVLASAIDGHGWHVPADEVLEVTSTLPVRCFAAFDNQHGHD
ncbi:hypothetical protein BVX95_01200 [archaeon D22]|nr:hypothetical protein BVX95_01200 [archaeon D22]